MPDLRGCGMALTTVLIAIGGLLLAGLVMFVVWLAGLMPEKTISPHEDDRWP